MMEAYDSNTELLTSRTIIKKNTNLYSKKDPILCLHCKRTANNGIRCIGMCVADNDY